MRFRTAGRVNPTRRPAHALSCLLALAFLALAGCYLPPFDEKFSETEHFAASLSPVARLGPVGMEDWMYEGGYFVPSRGSTSPTDGYWVRQSGTELLAAYLSGSSIYQGNGTSTNALSDGFVAFPLSELEASSISTSTNKRGLLAIFGSNPTSCMPVLATDASYGLNIIQYPMTISFGSSNLIGASFRIQSQNLDCVSVLYQSTASPPVFSGGTKTADSTLALSLGSITLTDYSNSTGTVPALKPGAFFGYCSYNGWYYVSGYRKDDSSLYSAYWPGQLDTYSPVKLPVVGARIAAILSTGRLLAIGDGVMYLYTLSGSLVTSFMTGSMHFAYEYCDSYGKWYCYFTRAISIHNDKDDKVKVYIDVYRCLTSDLDTFSD